MSVILQYFYRNLSSGQIILCDVKLSCCDCSRLGFVIKISFSTETYRKLPVLAPKITVRLRSVGLKPTYFPLPCSFLEENQCELLQNNGLPLMIQVLTESQDEELIKAATFVLQNCKQMSKFAGIALKMTVIISISLFC